VHILGRADYFRLADKPLDSSLPKEIAAFLPDLGSHKYTIGVGVPLAQD
jgi:hypothetical protein